MRRLLFLLCLTTLCSLVQAQEQEKKLADRLLQPDLTLANAAQDRKFTGTDATAANKEFSAKSFFSGEAQPLKSFAGVKQFSATEFPTSKFSRAKAAAAAKASAEMAYANTKFATRESSLVRTSNEENKKATVREYAGSKPFLGKGTRQEILSQEDKPLTIDEIRELLNRNK